MLSYNPERNAMSDDIQLKPRMGTVTESPSEPNVEKPLAEDNETVTPTPAPTPETGDSQMSVVRYLDEPLWRVKGWIQLLGVLFILQGAAMVLSIWGIVLCWLPIWMGVTLFSAANHIRGAAEMDDQVVMKVALEKIALFFKINGIMILIGLGLTVLAVIAMMMGFMGSIAMMGQQPPQGW